MAAPFLSVWGKHPIPRLSEDRPDTKDFGVTIKRRGPDDTPTLAYGFRYGIRNAVGSWYDARSERPRLRSLDTVDLGTGWLPLALCAAEEIAPELGLSGNQRRDQQDLHAQHQTLVHFAP
ncbi:hypothetical protein IMCC21224_1833 [Puniceibacterium sp. IMCC21224]|nr:hypothetical protein IMCC21224_1833 [Puniceibacterium sp. IMCC21224]